MNDVTGKICIPVTAQLHWGCGSSLLPFVLLLRIEAIVAVITCSDSGNSFLLLEHQRPQQPMCLQSLAMGITVRRMLCTAVVGTWPSVTMGCFLCTVWSGSGLSWMLKGRLTPKLRALPVIVISIAHAFFQVHVFLDQWEELHVEGTRTSMLRVQTHISLSNLFPPHLHFWLLLPTASDSTWSVQTDEKLITQFLIQALKTDFHYYIFFDIAERC